MIVRILGLTFATVGFASSAVAEESTSIAPPAPMEEVIVLGKFIPDEKRTTSEIANVLDEEALGLMADSSVGDALSRVTGLSLVGGKYVYVRGLGERYSSTLLDGSRISSPVPFQKTVPLDIVPKSIVRNLLVQKTYSAQYPGDFSGGVVDIRTRSTPEENFLDLSFTLGGNSETTGGDGLKYSGGDADNWGYDDGTRHIPENIALLSSDNFEDIGFPEDRALGASFYNNWDIREFEIKPDFAGDAELGYRYELDNGMSIGILAAGKYDNSYRQTDTEFARYNFTGAAVNQLLDYDRETTRQTVTMSGFINLGFELNNDNAITITHVILRQTDDEIQQERGESSEFGFSFTPVENIRLQFTENEIRSTAIKGEHYFNIGESVNGALFNWRYVDGSGLRESPDTRTYTYFEEDGLQNVSDSFTQLDAKNIYIAPERQYQKLNDTIEEYGFDLELPFLIGDIDVVVKGGYSEYERTRDSEDRLFRFDLTNIAPDFVRLETPRQLFSLDNWGAGYLDVDDFSGRAADSSDIFPFAQSSEETSGYYLAFDAQVTERIRVQAGVRKEDTTLAADAYGGSTLPGTDNQVSEGYDDTLPSGSVTFEFINDMQLRLAYSETVNRPSLLEITGSTIRNPEDSQLYRGNVFLQPAELTNYDLRWEWYFGEADSVSVGLFRKEFDEPIELGKIEAENEIFTWYNAEEADLEGVELEFRKDLFFDRWFEWGPDWDLFTLSANVSFIDSEVTLFGPGETAGDVPLTGNRGLDSVFENQRQLTGQSDLLGNLMLTYSNYETGIEGSLAYNYTGERIALVGAVNAPDVIEEARGKLDFLLKYGFELWQTQLQLEFKLQNLLDAQIEWTQGGRVYEQYRPGVNYSIGVKMSL